LYWKKYGGLKVPSRIGEKLHICVVQLISCITSGCNVMAFNSYFPGENDADSKKKSGSMSDDGMSFFLFILLAQSIHIIDRLSDLPCT
jgi:hypothetical protein